MNKKTANKIIAECKLVDELNNEISKDVYNFEYKKDQIYITSKSYHSISGILLNCFTTVARKYDADGGFYIGVIQNKPVLIIF